MSYSIGQPDRSASVTAPGSLIQSSGMPHAERVGGAHHGPRQALVGVRVEPAGQPLHGSHREQPAGRDIRNLSHPTRERRTPPRPQVVRRVGRRFDEEHAQRGIRSQQTRDEVLVAAPHVVPRLERHHHEIGHRALR